MKAQDLTQLKKVLLLKRDLLLGNVSSMEMQALKRCRPLLHDGAARGRFTDECHGSDRRMLGQRLAGDLPGSVNRIEHACRQARMRTDFRKETRRQRTPLGRLMHDRAARSKRWRNFPGRQHERRIPGRDHANGAYRLT